MADMNSEGAEFGGIFKKLRKKLTTKKGRERRSDRRAAGKGLGRVRHGLTTAKGRKRRTERRAAGRGFAKLKKIQKYRPLRRIATHPVFKKIVGAIPVVGPAVAGAIDAGESIAKVARSKMRKVQDAEDRISEAVKSGAPRDSVKRLKRKANIAANEAAKEMRKVGDVLRTERNIKSRIGKRAKAGDRRAQAAAKVIGAKARGSREGLRRAKREAKALGVKGTGDVRKAAAKLVKKQTKGLRKKLKTARGRAPSKGEVVVLIGGKRMSFSESGLRKRARARKGGR